MPKKYSNKIQILYPAVDPSIADGFVSVGTANEAPHDQVSSVVLFVGRLVARKGVDDLLQAVNTLQNSKFNLKLEIVGDGPELENLKSLVNSMGLSKIAKFYGSLAGKALYERYASCDVFVMPSKTTRVDVEGFGTVFLEAGAFGKPCIGTKSGGIPEAIRDSETGLLVPEGDVKALAEAISKLLSDPLLARKLGSNARQLVLREFTWKSSTQKLVSILASEK